MAKAPCVQVDEMLRTCLDAMCSVAVIEPIDRIERHGREVIIQAGSRQILMYCQRQNPTGTLGGGWWEVSRLEIDGRPVPDPWPPGFFEWSNGSPVGFRIFFRFCGAISRRWLVGALKRRSD